ncbi:MAG: BlaI/MecI/CopY family transcriptional regulator [Planctomycetota bacterium]
MTGLNELGRRERQILETVVRLRRASVAEVRDALPDPPSYSAIRTTMGILVDKGHLQFQRDGRRYLYRAARSPSRVRKRALNELVRNLFDGSAEQVVDALIDPSSRRIDAEELDRIAELVRRAREKRTPGKQNG